MAKRKQYTSEQIILKLREAEVLLGQEKTVVDTRTEKLTQKGLRKSMEGKTSFSIAHRLATIRDSAKIVVSTVARLSNTHPIMT